MRRLLAIGLGCSCLFAGTAQAATSHTVTIRRDAYSPAYLRIQPGDSVLWRNADSRVHTATALPGAEGFFATGVLQPGQQFTQLFRRAGRYGYFDATKPRGKRGVVQVGADREKPRVTRFSTRSTPRQFTAKAQLSEDMRLVLTIRRGDTRIVRRATARLGEGGLTYTFRFKRAAVLSPGRYRATLESRDVAGNRGRVVSSTFRVR